MTKKTKKQTQSNLKSDSRNCLVLPLIHSAVDAGFPNKSRRESDVRTDTKAVLVTKKNAVILCYLNVFSCVFKNKTRQKQ